MWDTVNGQRRPAKGGWGFHPSNPPRPPARPEHGSRSLSLTHPPHPHPVPRRHPFPLRAPGVRHIRQDQVQLSRAPGAIWPRADTACITHKIHAF